MRHLVFIVGNYYPNFSAVGSCVNNVVNSLKNTCDITVICSVSKSEQVLDEIYNGTRIIRISPRNVVKRLAVEERLGEGNHIHKKLNNIQLVGLRAKKYLTAITSKHNIEEYLESEYYDALKKLDKNIDAIIPACLPFEGVLAATKYGEENNIKVIPYFFDPFADNEALHRTKKNKEKKMQKHLKLEEYVIKNAEKVIMMNHMKEHFQQCFSKYEDKFITLEHPTLIIDNDEIVFNEEKHNNKIKLTYAGAFNKGIREPDYLLKLIANSNDKFELNLYTVGNCRNMIKEYSDENLEKILDHGSVDKEKAIKALRASDILISVGNVVSNQTPSKIFEYIAMGKPLIHFYYKEDDQVLKILEKYELSICLKQSEEVFEKNLKLFQQFCLDNLNKSMSKEKIKELYEDALPETTGKVILKILSAYEKGR